MFRGNPRTALPPRDVAPDTGVVIVGVRNYDHQEMVVFMESPNGRWRIGSVPGMHESLFVLPSTVMGPVRGFVIAVIPVGSQMQSYQTGFIQRTPGRVVVVGIEVGEVEPVPEVALPEA